MKAQTAMPLRAYECNVKGNGWQRTEYALTASKARYLYWLGVTEAWPGIPITAIEVHACSRARRPETPEAFRGTAERRGVPFARVGMAIEVEGHCGVIVRANDSANFDVAFEEGPYKGQTGNCHPNWETRYFGRDGEVLADFRRMRA